jgi:hypothetical protein
MWAGSRCRPAAEAAGNFRSGFALWDREATVKVYGVAVAMPQG